MYMSSPREEILKDKVAWQHRMLLEDEKQIRVGDYQSSGTD
jgi:hypothetical protein